MTEAKPPYKRVSSRQKMRHKRAFAAEPMARLYLEGSVMYLTRSIARSTNIRWKERPSRNSQSRLMREPLNAYHGHHPKTCVFFVSASYGDHTEVTSYACHPRLPPSYASRSFKIFSANEQKSNKKMRVRGPSSKSHAQVAKLCQVGLWPGSRHSNCFKDSPQRLEPRVPRRKLFRRLPQSLTRL